MNEFKEQKETKQKSTRRIYLKIIGLIVFIICFVLLAFATIRKPTNLNTTTKQVSIKKVYKPEKKEKSLNVSETPRPTPTIIKVSEKIGFNNSLNNALDNILSKELMGRIDVVLPFNKINEEVAKKYIKKYLKNKDIKIEDLLNLSDIEKYGLRNLRNLINKYNKKSINYN